MVKPIMGRKIVCVSSTNSVMSYSTYFGFIRRPVTIVFILIILRHTILLCTFKVSTLATVDNVMCYCIARNFRGLKNRGLCTN